MSRKLAHMGQESTTDSKKKKKGNEKIAQRGTQTQDDPEIKLTGQLYFATCHQISEHDWLWTTPNDRRGQARGQWGHGVLSGHSECLDCLDSVVFSGKGGAVRGWGEDGH